MKKCFYFLFSLCFVILPEFSEADTIICTASCCYISIEATVHPNGGCYGGRADCFVPLRPLPGCDAQK